MTNATNTSTPAAPAAQHPLVIPSHPHSFFGLQFDTRYWVDAMLVIAGLGGVFVALALISEPDVASLMKKAVSAGKSGIEAAAIA